MLVHMKRKHPSEFNPFDLLKDPAYTYKYHNAWRQAPENSDSASPQTPDYSASILPQIDLSDPIQVVERSAKAQMLLNDIKKLSKMERARLVYEVISLP
jgi:hypothetical protein